ncbi:MAG: glucan biosynthesis glucosyltransferase H, partial [Pseudomonadota bacterium]|nr:glucan biosynthesis glucosyltransferase H [Pseudomonadota bacterium]
MNEHTPEVPWPRWRRTLVGMAIAATTALGVWTMFKILYVEGITPLEMAILGLFAITFGWITMAFWSAVI